MRFTFLVIDQKRPGKTARRGLISAVQAGKGTWGRNEVAPRFAQVPFTGSPEEARQILSNCEYDFTASEFVITKTRERFDPKTDVMPDKVQFTKDLSGDDRLIFALTGKNTGTSCSVLQAPFIAGDNRVFWSKLFYPYRKLPGVRGLLRAVLHGWFSDTRKAFLAIPKAYQDAILSGVSKEEADYLRWLCFTEVK